MDSEKDDRLSITYWGIWEQTQFDPEYARLRSRLEALEGPYKALLAKLPPSDRQLLDQYITLRESMNRRLLECACAESLSCRADGSASADRVGLLPDLSRRSR